MTLTNYQIEKYRPQYHFTPPEKWINDPNGLVYHNGEYHLFYQYHPGSLIWGPMHWGHAVSPDMVHWEHLPIALYPDELGTIFSGSAAIDWHNTAGFGAGAMIVAYTYHLDDSDTGGSLGQRQSQAIAYSTDNGRTWTKYAGNPVIPVNPNEKDFRDPKILWYEPTPSPNVGEGRGGDQLAPSPNVGEGRGGGQQGYWLLLLAVDDSIWFYSSTDLKSWEKVSEFGEDQGSHAGVWETPDLFQLPIEGSDKQRWVLTVGLGTGAPAEGSGMQYFVGNFDGTTFTNDNSADMELWADYGADFYAAQGWNNAPDGRKLWIGWMNNWDYAREIPTPTWRGAMSLPRELSLRQTVDGLRIAQKPVVELESLRVSSRSWQSERIAADNSNLLEKIKGECLEILAEFDIAESSATAFVFLVRQGDTEQTAIRYDIDAQTLSVDRTEAGASDFSDVFPRIHTQPLASESGKIQLHLFIDRSSVEIFGNGGLLAMSERVFPAEESIRLRLFAEGGEAAVDSLTVYELASVWGEQI